MMKIRFAVLLSALLLVLVAPSRLLAAEELRLLEIKNAKGETEIHYYYKTKPYLFIEGASLRKAKPGTRVCFNAKLRTVAGGVVLLDGAEFDGIRFEPAAGGDIGVDPGSNIWLGGSLSGDDAAPVFKIDGVVKLASDAELFKERWAKLEKSAGTPEDYLSMAWWLNRGKTISTEKDYESYVKNIEKCMRKVVELESAGLEDEAKEKLAARVGRYRKLIDKYGANITDGEVVWYIENLRRMLRQNTAAVQALSDPKAEVAADKIANLKASIWLDLGKLSIRYFPRDKEKAIELLKKSSALNPSDSELAKLIRPLGFVRYGNAWVTPEEAKDLKAKAESEAKEAAAREEELKKSNLMLAERKKVVAGEGSEKARSLVDPLLSNPKPDNLAELASSLSGLSEDVARYALWKTATLPASVDPVALITAALGSRNPVIRQDAADLLVARGEYQDIMMLVKHIVGEKEPAVRAHMVEAISMQGGKASIDSLIILANYGNLPADTVSQVAGILETRTKQKFGNDGLLWKKWWNENKATFKE
ncbi:MAG: hypothetical protein JXR97_02410 [Planctomycetes bacterium]|nr:hypothetical protein [Planctomycetota bacterium]